MLCRLSQPCISKELRCDQYLSSMSASLVSFALPADVFSTFSDRDPEVSKNENVLEDKSRLSAWLNRLGLSSRLTKYTSLLRSVNPLPKSDSEPPSSTSVNTVSVSGVNSTMEVESQGLPTCGSFVLRVLPPYVGLNTVMTMKKGASSKSPHQTASHHYLPRNTSRALSSTSKESVTVEPSSTQYHVLFSNRTLVEEKSPSLRSSVNYSPRFTQPVHSMPVTTLSSADAFGFGHNMLSTESTSELLRSVPSVVVTPDVALTSCPGLASAVADTDHSSCDKTPLIFDNVSTLGEGWKMSTPAKRPQSLDVIPWSPLSRSACTLTGSLSTVVHSHVNSTNSSSSSSVTMAPCVIQASPVNIPAL